MSVDAPQNITLHPWALHPFINLDLQQNIDRNESHLWWLETTKTVAEVAMSVFVVGTYVAIGVYAPAYIVYAFNIILFDIYLETFNGGLFTLFSTFVIKPLEESIDAAKDNRDGLLIIQENATEIESLTIAQLQERLESAGFNINRPNQPHNIQTQISSLPTLRNPIAAFEYYQEKKDQADKYCSDMNALIEGLKIYLDLSPNSYEYNSLESNGESIHLTIKRVNLENEGFSSQELFVEKLKSDIEKLESFGNPDYATTISYLKRIYLNESEELSQTPLSDHLQPQNITNIKNQAFLISQRLYSNLFSHAFKFSIYKIKAAFMAHIIMRPTETRVGTPAFGQFHTELSELLRRQLYENGFGPLFSTHSGRVFTLDEIGLSSSIPELAVQIFGKEPIPGTEADLEVAG